MTAANTAVTVPATGATSAGTNSRPGEYARRPMHREGSGRCRATILGGEEPGPQAATPAVFRTGVVRYDHCLATSLAARAGVSNGRTLGRPCGRGFLLSAPLRAGVIPFLAADRVLSLSVLTPQSGIVAGIATG